jgi:hypothetical protein
MKNRIIHFFLQKQKCKLYLHSLFGRLDQLVSRLASGQAPHLPYKPGKKHKGRLAQLVQSICLTSRGSGVRIPHRPQSKNRTRKWPVLFLSEVLCLHNNGDQKQNRTPRSGVRFLDCSGHPKRDQRSYSLIAHS